VTRKTINTVGRGRFVPSTPLALKLSRALGVRVEEIFRLTER
jgi:putative transcriptional regulator